MDRTYTLRQIEDIRRCVHCRPATLRKNPPAVVCDLYVVRK